LRSSSNTASKAEDASRIRPVWLGVSTPWNSIARALWLLRSLSCRDALSRSGFRGYGRSVLALLWTIIGTTRSLFSTQREVALENLALRQQVAVLIRTRGGRRLRLGLWDRAFWLVLSQRWKSWREFWRLLSRRR